METRFNWWSQLPVDEFSRQIIVPEVGAFGQKKISDASIAISGDPSIAEIAAEYLNAAGVGHVKTNHSDNRSEAQWESITARAHRNGVSINMRLAPSPLADQAMLGAAGMMLAIDSIKRILGLETKSWSIEF